MAKCVQIVGQGIPARVSDEDAFQIVDRDHDGQYCPKSVWRGSTEPLRAKLVGNKITATPTLARNLQHSRK